MECWVSNKGKKGHWSSFLKDFQKIFTIEDFGIDIFDKGQISRPFSGLAPLKNMQYAVTSDSLSISYYVWHRQAL